MLAMYDMKFDEDKRRNDKIVVIECSGRSQIQAVGDTARSITDITYQAVYCNRMRIASLLIDFVDLRDAQDVL